MGTKVLQFALHHLEADDSNGNGGGVSHDPKKLGVIYAGVDGSMGTHAAVYLARRLRLEICCVCCAGYIVPQEEVTHRRLASLQNKLVHTCVTQILLRTFPSSTYGPVSCSLEHTAGLNPKGFRIFRPTTQYFTHQRCDSNLIWILEEGLTLRLHGRFPCGMLDCQLLRKYHRLDHRQQRELANR